MKLLKIVAGLILLVNTSSSFAGTSQGKILKAYVHEGDLVFFHIAGNIQTPAPCATTQWAVSLTDQKGRALYAMLLTALALDKDVFIQGNNTCSDWGDRETPHYGYISS